MIAFKLTGADALMFRDGRPFNQSDEGADAAISRFPPPPPTVAGALRLMFAAQLGFPEKAWPKAALGDGTDWSDPETLPSDLRFSATLLSREGDGLLFPCPLHIARGKRPSGDTGITCLKPHLAISCDLGASAFLPAATADFAGIMPLADCWITASGMGKVLQGKLPAETEVIREDQLAVREMRVGIGRDSDRRMAHEGALYTAGFVRMADGVSLIVGVEGIDGAMAENAVLQRLGGEHRSAFIEPSQKPMDLPDAPGYLPSHGGKFHYAAITLSPVLLEAMPAPGGEIAGLTGMLVSACTGKPQMIGGWDSQARRPLPMRPALPAGSVFFMKCDSEREALAAHGCTIGGAGAWGFGQVLIARWEQ